jgi:hypothetical protein
MVHMEILRINRSAVRPTGQSVRRDLIPTLEVIRATQFRSEFDEDMTCINP